MLLLAEIVRLLTTEIQELTLQHTIIQEVHHQHTITNVLLPLVGVIIPLLQGLHRHRLVLLAEAVVLEVAEAVASVEEEEGINSLFFFLFFVKMS